MKIMIKKKHVEIFLEVSVWAELAKKAVMAGLSMKEYISKIIEQEIKSSMKNK